MEENKFEVTLEQITPYIWYLKEDLVRTTEFKPRLDYFLYEGLSPEERKNYILPSRKKETETALDYKVKIEKIIEPESCKETIQIFRASHKDKYNYKIKGQIRITFFSLNKNVIKLIKDRLPEFLATTNFGKRKNKCYGSFYIAPGDKYYKKLDEIEILKKLKFFKEDKNYIELPEGDIVTVMKILEKESGKSKEGTSLAGIVYKCMGDRKESIGSMKILKDENGKYRLYYIPNYKLIKALKGISGKLTKFKGYEKFVVNNFIRIVDGGI